MSKKNKSSDEVLVHKKINGWSLTSLLLPVVFIVVLLFPWSSMFILRDDVLVPRFIHWGAALVVGLSMIITGIIGLVRNKRKGNQYKASWLGIIGIILGAIFFLPSAFFLGDYLIYTFLS